MAAAGQHADLQPTGGATSRIIASGRLLGFLSQTMGDLGEAVAQVEDAVALCRKAGLPA